MLKQAARNLAKYSTVEDRRLLADLAEMRRVLREREERLDREEAFRAGEAAGAARGRLEGKLEVAGAMLARGVDRGLVEEVLGLDLAAHGL